MQQVGSHRAFKARKQKTVSWGQQVDSQTDKSQEIGLEDGSHNNDNEGHFHQNPVAIKDLLLKMKILTLYPYPEISSMDPTTEVQWMDPSKKSPWIRAIIE